MPPQRDIHTAFRQKASELLVLTAPSTSSHLGYELLQTFIRDQAAPPSDLKESYCTACGMLVVPGITATMSRVKKANSRSAGGNPGNTQPKPHAPKPSSMRKAVSRRCLNCRRSTIFNIPSPESNQALAPKPDVASQTQSAALRDESSAKISSKKRAQVRKERDALRSLLHQRKQNEVAHSTLDLMDFMKS